MKSFVTVLSLIYCCLLQAGEFSTMVRNMEVVKEDEQYQLNADIEYRLSPLVKEALKKGISMSWVVRVKVERKNLLWNTTINEIVHKYQIQNHDVLNLYSVKLLKSNESIMFSTLAGAIDFIAKIRNLVVLEQSMIEQGERYQLGLKIDFERESLPVPIRPFSYFDKQWGLSSQWALWPLKN